MKQYTENEKDFAIRYFNYKHSGLFIDDKTISAFFDLFEDGDTEEQLMAKLKKDSSLGFVGEDLYYIFFKEPLVTKAEALDIINVLSNEDLTSIFYTSDEFADLPNNHIIKEFYRTLDSWYIPSGGDCTCAINYSEGTLSMLRSNYGIDLDETILFERDTSFWSNSNQGLVITDWGFYCIPDNDDSSSRFSFSWKDFNNVRYKELAFYFNDGNDNIATLSWKNFYKGLKESAMKDLGPKLAVVLTEIANLAPADIDPLDLANEERYDEALELVNANLEKAPNDWYGHFAKGRILYCVEANKDVPDQENIELAQTELNKSLNLYDSDDKDILSSIYANLGFVNALAGNTYLARNYFINSLEYCDDETKGDINQYLSNAEETLKETWDNYTQVYEYKDRKFIMPIKDGEIGGCWVDGIDVFRMSNIPSCFTFPTGHPIANQLYIGHPYNPSLYVPLEASEDLFFIDKVHELCYLLECLGAEEISITSIKGKNVTEFNEYNINVAANGDVKLFSGEAERSKSGSKNNEYNSRNQRTIKIKLDPLKKPYVPEGLIWYNEQPQWQRLVNSRLNGNMLEYNEFVSNSQTKFTSSTEIQDIKASAGYLWTKIHGEVETNEKVQFKETEDTQWKVDVKFRSIKEFSDSNNEVGKKSSDNNNSGLNQLSEAENSYAEEVRFCLSEGEIGEREHRFLNRMRFTLGLSEERAAQIEKMLSQPQLSDNEKEYFDALRDEIVDNQIQEKSYRLLNRLRSSLGISDKRAKEIEQIALKHI